MRSKETIQIYHKAKEREYKMGAFYLDIKKDLLDKILSGVYPQGSIIPNEYELAEIYKVSRPTIRQEFAQVIQTFDQEVKEKGLTPSTKVLTFKKEKAEEEVCQKLNLSETEEVYKLVRLRYIDDQPNVLVTTYVPCRLFEHLSDIDFEKESLYQTFHKEGRDITSIKRKLDVILADETCADLLDIKNGDPLFYFHSTGYDATHTAIEYSIAKYRGDRNSFVFELSNTVYYS